MRILLFAKRPLPGRAKTRLIPALGAEGAAQLHRRLLWRALANARAAKLGPVELWVDQCGDEPLWARCREEFNVSLHQQCEGDIGARMAAALGDALQRSPDGALLIGCDCPPMSAMHLREAAAALAEHEVVFFPVEDGGYVLVGLRQSQVALFDGVPWSTERVMAETRQRLRQLGLRHWEGATLWDVDRPEDLARLTAYPDLLPE